MAITYDPTLATAKDRVRFYIGDTDTTADVSEALDDGEITFALTNQGDERQAAILCGESLLARWARFVDVKAADYEERFSQRVVGLTAALERLRARGTAYALPVAGGWEVAKVEAQQDDTARIPPSFERGMLDNPRQGTTLDDRLGGQ
jgi:hypothetical protein